MKFSWPARFDAATFFLVAAIVLNIVYLSYLPTFFASWPIHHKGQRFLYTAHLADTLLGHPDTLPVSMLDTAGMFNQLQNITGMPCEQWKPALRRRYCNNIRHNPSPSPPFDIPLEPDKSFAYVPNSNASHFPFIGYAPYVVGAFIGLVLQLSPFMILKAAVISNAAFSILFGYYILRLLPILRWPACYLMLLPTAFLYRTFIMPDAMTMELCFFFIAWSLNLLYTPRVLSVREKSIFILLAVAVALVKISFFCVPLIALIVPSLCFGGKRQKLTVIFAAFFAALGSSLLWVWYVLVTYPDTMAENGLHPHAEFFSLVFGMLMQPGNVLRVLSDMFFDPPVILDKLKMLIAWRAPMSDVAALACIAPPLLMAVVNDDEPAPHMGSRQRWLSLLLYVANIAILTMIMFLHEAQAVSQLQRKVFGRYFLAIFLFLPLALHRIIPLKPLPKIVHFLLIGMAVAGIAYANMLLLGHVDALSRHNVFFN